jgi:UDP-glucose 4-epimerase
MDKVVLVTGVAGFIGRYIARTFANQGWSVIGISSSPPENAPLLNLKAYHRLRLPHQGLHDLLRQYSPQLCIHCAGRASVNLSINDPVNDFYENSALVLETLNAIRLNAPQCRFISLSSAAVYGNPQSLPVSETQSCAPLSPYGFHKWQCEQLCAEFAKVYDLPTASVRIFSAYGPGLRRQVLWDICHKALIQGEVKLQGTGQESRDFVHVLDIANALMVIANHAPMQGEAYNLGSGREVSIAELANLVLTALEFPDAPQFDGVVPLGTPLNWQADMTKLKAMGFEPTVALERGVKIFVEWCRAELIGV